MISLTYKLFICMIKLHLFQLPNLYFNMNRKRRGVFRLGWMHLKTLILCRVHRFFANYQPC